jgi:hypothetical protein
MTPRYHRFIKNSGSTNICVDCGCVEYTCKCCHEGKHAYSVWNPKAKRWYEYRQKTSLDMPECSPQRRDVPDWVAAEHST